MTVSDKVKTYKKDENKEEDCAATEGSRKRALTKNDKINLHDLGGNLKLFYQFSHFISYYKLNRHYPYRSFRKFQVISLFIARLQSKPFLKKMAKTWMILRPDIKWDKKLLNRWTLRYFRYINELFWEITFYFNREYPEDADHFYPIEGYEEVEKAVRKKKGILVPTLHIGEMFHPGATFLKRTVVIDGKPWTLRLAGIASAENEFLFRDYLKSHPEARIIITGKKHEVKDEILSFLRHRYMVFIMQDYAHRKQFRVPFIYGSSHHSFLMPCPSLLADLYIHNDFLILPIVSLPGKDLRYSTVKVLPELDLKHMDPNNEKDPILREEVIKFQKGELSEKQARGLVLVYINRILNPYILQYPYLWEEAISFLKRANYKIHYRRIKDYSEFFVVTIEELIEFLENSYEPGRNDSYIIPSLRNLLSKVPYYYSKVSYKKEEKEKEEEQALSQDGNPSKEKSTTRLLSGKITQYLKSTKTFILDVKDVLFKHYFIHNKYLDIGLRTSKQVFRLIYNVLKTYLEKFKGFSTCRLERWKQFKVLLNEYYTITLST